MASEWLQRPALTRWVGVAQGSCHHFWEVFAAAESGPVGSPNGTGDQNTHQTGCWERGPQSPHPYEAAWTGAP